MKLASLPIFLKLTVKGTFCTGLIGGADGIAGCFGGYDVIREIARIGKVCVEPLLIMEFGAAVRPGFGEHFGHHIANEQVLARNANYFPSMAVGFGSMSIQPHQIVVKSR
ncbi:MAG TPA: hypothetical protein VE988_13560 [Gemmataceae bacterium]|nr:hypothetical protein [Gemmataceae bacterium]